MSLLDKLKNVTDMVKPEKMIMGLLESYLPQMKEFADNLNRAEADGGILKESEAMAILTINFNNEKPIVSITTLSTKDDDVLISRNIPVEHLMPKNNEDGSQES